MLCALLLAGFVVSATAGAAHAQTDAATPIRAAVAQSYLAEFRALAEVDWPKNRTINVVCHGHSVPAGYFKTPAVHALEAYPHLLRAGLSERFPHAVINVIVTAIGGENSERGAERFERDVLSHRPDLVTIDYGLNDRRLGLERAEKSWRAMIEQAQAHGVKVLLLTPTPDIGAKWRDAGNPLQQHAAQIRKLAAEYHVGLVDSLAAFEACANRGDDVQTLMSQSNHPNGKGHALVAAALLAWFR
jgi:lysophospholipase L1-like esterase